MTKSKEMIQENNFRTLKRNMKKERKKRMKKKRIKRKKTIMVVMGTGKSQRKKKLVSVTEK